MGYPQIGTGWVYFHVGRSAADLAALLFVSPGKTYVLFFNIAVCVFYIIAQCCQVGQIYHFCVSVKVLLSGTTFDMSVVFIYIIN